MLALAPARSPARLRLAMAAFAVLVVLVVLAVLTRIGPEAPAQVVPVRTETISAPAPDVVLIPPVVATNTPEGVVVEERTADPGPAPAPAPVAVAPAPAPEPTYAVNTETLAPAPPPSVREPDVPILDPEAPPVVGDASINPSYDGHAVDHDSEHAFDGPDDACVTADGIKMGVRQAAGLGVTCTPLG